MFENEALVYNTKTNVNLYRQKRQSCICTYMHTTIYITYTYRNKKVVIWSAVW